MHMRRAGRSPSVRRVGGGEDGGARIEGSLNAGLGDGDGLLLHGLVDGDLRRSMRARVGGKARVGWRRPGAVRRRGRRGSGRRAEARRERVGLRAATRLVVRIHLVKLVDATDAIVGQHQRARLNAELACLVILAHLHA